MDGFSERNVDYSRLWSLLREKRWQEANEETMLKLLEASGRMESMVASGRLMGEGLSTLFQLLDTAGRLKMLEALAVSERLVLEEVPRSRHKKVSPLKPLAVTERFTHADVDALFRVLDLSDRFELSAAIPSSRRLSVKDKHVLLRVLEFAALPSGSGSAPIKHRQDLLASLILGWKEQGWHLTRRDVEFCPCKDLQTIDEFWTIHSCRRFGFSVQADIWEAVRKEADWENVEAFGRTVGWRGSNTWIDYEESTIFAAKPQTTFLDRKCSPGHLPIFPLTGWWCWMGGMKAMIDRLQCCSDLVAEDGDRSTCDWNLLPPARARLQVEDGDTHLPNTVPVPHDKAAKLAKNDRSKL